MTIQMASLGVVQNLAGGTVVTITNDFNSAFRFGNDAIAYHHFNLDGTVDEQDNVSSAIQINASTDWIIPNGDASSSYRVRHVSATGDTGTPWVPAGAINTWLSFSTNRSYRVTDTTVTAGGQSVVYGVEIDDGGGTALDTGTMTLDADREDF